MATGATETPTTEKLLGALLKRLPMPHRKREAHAVLEATSAVEQIGEAAGQLWQLLDTGGATRVSELARELDLPHDVVMQAVGWLAREEKVCIERTSRGAEISLR